MVGSKKACKGDETEPNTKTPPVRRNVYQMLKDGRVACLF